MKKIKPRAILENLIKFNTTSKESNLELIYYIRNFLNEYNVKSNIIFNEDNSKANLHCVIGPEDKPGIILSGHTDVVPVEGQKWDFNPFSLTEKSGKLYGRGTADMKSFIAVSLSIVPILVSKKLKKPIHFAFSYDEEVGCLGAPSLVEFINNLPVKPMATIVGEPTKMEIVNSHKGVMAFRTVVSGLEGHSSEPEKGSNTIIAASKLINYLDKLFEEEKVNSNNLFDPPYTTINVGLINGGTALNIIPKECSFIWEYRYIPEQNPNSIISKFNFFAKNVILKEMRKVFKEAEISTTPLAHVLPLKSESAPTLENLVMKLAETNTLNTVSYGTEGGIFQDKNIPTIVCGPGSIEQAHKANEFIELNEIEKCEKFLFKLIKYIES